MGVLTLPMAIRNAGLMVGSLGLAFIAFVCVYCMRMLVDAAHKACARLVVEQKQFWFGICIRFSPVSVFLPKKMLFLRATGPHYFSRKKRYWLKLLFWPKIWFFPRALFLFPYYGKKNYFG